MINQQKLTALFMDLAAISSPSFYEKPVFDFIEKYLEGKKCSVHRLPYTASNGNTTENMIIRVKASNLQKKSLFFDAHADTVPPYENIRPVLDGDIIRSSGNSVLGADDKAGIAAMLVVLDCVLEHNIAHGELVFIISSAEEVGLVGARFIPEDQLKGLDYGVILDSSGPVGTITLKAPYSYEYKITVKGLAAHAGMAPEKGVNAIRAAAGLIMELPTGRISEDTVSNVGMIEGGIARNVVPDECTIIGEFRSLVEAKCAPLVKQVEEAVAKHKKNAVDIICELKKKNEGYNYSADTPIVAFVTQAHKAIGITPSYEESTGATNANIYVGKGLCSTVVSVGMEEIHSVKEYIRVVDLVDTTRLILKMIELA